MAAGAFVQGSSIELSADSPIKEPYIVYVQGGLTYEHAYLAVLHTLETLNLTKNRRKNCRFFNKIRIKSRNLNRQRQDFSAFISGKKDKIIGGNLIEKTDEVSTVI